MEDTSLGEEERAGADGEQSAFPAWVFLLQSGICFDEGDGLGVVLEWIDIAAGNDEDIELAEAVVGFFEVNVGSKAGTLIGDCVFGVGDESAFEGFGCYGREFSQLQKLFGESLSSPGLLRS